MGGLERRSRRRFVARLRAGCALKVSWMGSSDTQMLHADHAAVMETAVNRGMGRVLVIDGDPGRRIALAGALGTIPHEVEIAATAMAGTYLARMSRPDVVIVEST